MMKLKDGCLYQARNGKRYRVSYNNNRGVFECLRSFRGFWDAQGLAINGYEGDLLFEVQELRWVPFCGIKRFMELSCEGDVYRVVGDHVQRQVTRTEAQAMHRAIPTVYMSRAEAERELQLLKGERIVIT